ncbi:MAG: OmpH family outer membrane protein [Flavobacteriales bacterium]|nr:OmpH family outer membrane protein [Flavobacteriales bacterium]
MKSTLITICFVVATTMSFAQKVAHADINAILSVMPENQKINEDLRIYATGLSKMVDDKKAQLEIVVEQFNQTLGRGDTLKAIELQKKGLELDKDYQQSGAQADQLLQQKRNELMQPVLTRIRAAMETVAKKGGYECVLNSVDGAGTSVVLWSPQGTDITRAVVEELGIELKKSEPATPSEQKPVEDPDKKKKK